MKKLILLLSFILPGSIWAQTTKIEPTTINPTQLKYFTDPLIIANKADWGTENQNCLGVTKINPQNINATITPEQIFLQTGFTSSYDYDSPTPYRILAVAQTNNGYLLLNFIHVEKIDFGPIYQFEIPITTEMYQELKKESKARIYFLTAKAGCNGYGIRSQYISIQI